MLGLDLHLSPSSSTRSGVTASASPRRVVGGPGSRLRVLANLVRGMFRTGSQAHSLRAIAAQYERAGRCAEAAAMRCAAADLRSRRRRGM